MTTNLGLVEAEKGAERTTMMSTIGAGNHRPGVGDVEEEIGPATNDHGEGTPTTVDNFIFAKANCLKCCSFARFDSPHYLFRFSL